MVDGILNLSVWGYVVATLIMTHITIVGVTVFLHRHQAHKALDLHPVLSHFFRFWLWITTGMVTKAWVAIHRKHHAKCETVDDPHSPQILGIKKVLLEGAEIYREEAKNQQTMEKYGHGTPNDWLENHVYSPWSGKGLLVMLVLDLVLFGLAGISVWGIQMLWIPFFAAGVINGVGHWWGYRNYEVQDASTNILPLGILIGGEELHNNHHTFASSAKLSSKWWEFDIGWMYIRLFQFFRLAKVKKIPPKPRINPDKLVVDMDTVKAIINNRFQVMARYARDVVKSVHKDEMQRADQKTRLRLKKIRRLLIREESLIDERSRLRLNSVLKNHNSLITVYQFKQRLQEIWRRTATSNEHLLLSLQEWCKQAEETGIKSLQEFSKRLRTYSLSTA
ncbi:MAG: transposase [Gammaproteobacteria bacterium]